MTEGNDQIIKDEPKPEKSGFKKFIDSVVDFFKTTDFDVSMKNPELSGSFVKEKEGVSVGLGQGGTMTQLEYKDNKVKVSHEKMIVTEKEDDSKIG